DAALEALALGDADDVDQLAGREELRGHDLTDLVALQHLRLFQPDLAHDAHRIQVQLAEDAGLGLGHLLAAGLEAELQRVVAVAVTRADPDDGAGPGLDHRDGDVIAVVPEHLGHPDLAADQSFFSRHG